MISLEFEGYISSLKKIEVTDRGYPTSHIYLNGKKVNEIDRDYFEHFSNGIKDILEQELSNNENNQILSNVLGLLLEAEAITIKKWEDTITRKDNFYERKFEGPSREFLEDEGQVWKKNKIFKGISQFLNLDPELTAANEDLHSYLITRAEVQVNETRLGSIYAIGQLYYVYELKLAVINDLINYLEDKYNPTQEDSNDNPSIKFKLKKQEIALLFRILYKEGIIELDGNRERDKLTKLKKYIDNANIYYYYEQFSEYKKVDNIKNEFSDNRTDNNDNGAQLEIEFIEMLIRKLEDRLERGLPVSIQEYDRGY